MVSSTVGGEQQPLPRAHFLMFAESILDILQILSHLYKYKNTGAQPPGNIKPQKADNFLVLLRPDDMGVC